MHRTDRHRVASPAAIGFAVALLCMGACPSSAVLLGSTADPDAGTKYPLHGAAGHATSPPPTAAGTAGASVALDAGTAVNVAGHSAAPAAGAGGAAPAAGSTAPSDNDAGPLPPEPVRPTRLPTPKYSCPKLQGNGQYTFNGPQNAQVAVQIYVAKDAATKTGDGGPIILYWHATGSAAQEVLSGFGQANIDKVVALGGVVAVPIASTNGGPQTSLVWYADDNAVADEIVACAIAQAHIDTRHIHALGLDSGAAQALQLALVRSDYVASVISYSGGLTPSFGPFAAQDPSNHVAAILTYGSSDKDVVIIDFHMQSVDWWNTQHALGYYAMMCDHEQGHQIDAGVATQAWKFFGDHPYKVTPEPYATAVPVEFPSYCRNAP